MPRLIYKVLRSSALGAPARGRREVALGRLAIEGVRATDGHMMK